MGTQSLGNKIFSPCSGLTIVASAAVKKMKDYTQHGRVSTYRHSMAVSYYSYLLACKRLFLKIDRMSTLRGGMLHDLYLYDWHKGRP